MKGPALKILLTLTAVTFLLDTCSRMDGDRSSERVVGEGPRAQMLFDFNWHFHRGNIDGGEETTLDDSDWRLLDLPHDWSIEDIPGMDSPLDSNAIGGIDMGYFVGGTSWYRKKFSLSPEIAEKRIYLFFEGIYMNADIWLNGERLINHPYGYTSFWIDLSDNLLFDEENILAVQVKNEGRNSRWYSGSGIYRHVWLLITNPVHIKPWGIFITTPEVTESSAKVNIKTEVMNDREGPIDILLNTKILNQSGEEVARKSTNKRIEAASNAEVIQNLILETPELWSPDSPCLYKAVTEISNSDL